VKLARKTGEESLTTREAILNATEALMVEEGYMAVTSRRVAERAGFKSQLVHYHFGTMDDLILAVYERSEQEFLRRHLAALSSKNPLRALWESSIHPERTRLSQELIALSNRNAEVRKISTRIIAQMHSITDAFVGKYLDEVGADRAKYPPIVLSHIINGLSRSVVMCESLGIAAGRDEVLAFAERIFSELEALRKP
jgi:AcrR family transcriptional regulator